MASPTNRNQPRAVSSWSLSGVGAAPAVDCSLHLSRYYGPQITQQTDSSAPAAAADGSRIFRGWIVVFGVFITLLVTAGLGFYNASVILQAGRTELDTSVTAVSGATAVFFGVSGITSFLLAPQMDRVDIRWFYVTGGLVGAAALLGLRLVDSVTELYVFFGVFGIGFALGGLVPGTTVVARWFAVRRSVALSIATTGLSMGGILVTPLAARLIERETLAGAGPLMALVWLLGVIPIALLLIRSTPGELGLQPDGVPVAAGAAVQKPSDLPGATFEQAKASRFFRFLAVTYALVFLAQVGALAQLFNLGAERIDRAAGAAALSTLAFASVGGRLLGGVVVTKIPARTMTLVLIGVQAFALALIALADTRSALIAASAIFGLSVGNLLMLQPLLLAETFGVREYSRIYSFSQLFGTIGVAGGPFALGFLRDLFSYRTALLIGSGANLVAIATLLAAGSTLLARQTWERQTAG